MRWLLVLPLTGVQIAARLLAVALTVTDANFRIVGSGDATKKLAFEVDAQTTGKVLTLDTGAQTVDRTLSIPVLGGSDTIMTLATAQTVTGAKTLSAVTTVSNATTSTSTTTGALIVTGGVGVGGAVWSPNYNISGTSGAGFKLTTASGYGFVTLNGDVTFSGTCGFFGGASGDSNMYILAPPAFSILMRVNNNTNLSVDDNATAGNTRMMVWDVDNGTLERVSVGAADSGGAGFKVLRIPN